MIDVSLQAVPNQNLSIDLGGFPYDITVKEARGCMVLTLVRDNITILDGVRLVAGSPVIPARYQEAGNFVLLTPDDALPYYDQFGISQFLVYLDAAEVAALRGAT